MNPRPTSALLPPAAQAAAILARVAARGPSSVCAAGLIVAKSTAPVAKVVRQSPAIPAPSSSTEGAAQRGARTWDRLPRQGIQHADATAARPSDSFGVVGYGLFVFQRPGPIQDLPTLQQALASPRTRAREEQRSNAPVDAFTMLGEIGFLDI